jgi:thiosulfate dehydrogenase [quinone] large subunit
VIGRTLATVWLSGREWSAVLRVGLGLWWLESWRHKDKRGWLTKGTGIAWAKGVADKHRWSIVRTGFERTVAPRPKVMAYVVVFSELAIGLGITFGFLTPIALVAGAILNLFYFVLMIHDWAEQGQNWMMFLVSMVCLFDQANQVWSIDHLLHILGAG